MCRGGAEERAGRTVEHKIAQSRQIWIETVKSIFGFLSAFAKLWKATTSFWLSVCPAVRVGQLGSHWADFYEIWYLSTILKSVKKIQVSWNLTITKGLLYEYLCTFLISRSVILTIRNVAEKRCKENQITHFIFNIFSMKIVPFMR